MMLRDKVAVITGGASGIGRATVLRFLEEGAKVVIADFNAEVGAATMESIRELGFGESCRFVRTDVSREDDICRAITETLSAFGRLDCFFSNAGIPGALGPLEEVEVADWDATMAVLLRGPFLGLKYAARQFRQQQSGGVILSTASTSGFVGGSGPRAYSIAKAGVIHMTRVAAVDLARYRIRVNSIAPGPILTEISGKDLEKEGLRLDKAQPWPDHGEPSDIASAAAFLASDQARFITGHTLAVDGGCLADSGMEQRLQRGETWGTVVGMHHGTTGQKSPLRRLKPTDEG